HAKAQRIRKERKGILYEKSFSFSLRSLRAFPLRLCVNPVKKRSPPISAASPCSTPRSSPPTAPASPSAHSATHPRAPQPAPSRSCTPASAAGFRPPVPVSKDNAPPAPKVTFVPSPAPRLL